MTTSKRPPAITAEPDGAGDGATGAGATLHRVVVEVECPQADRVEATARRVGELLPAVWDWRTSTCGCATGTTIVSLHPRSVRALERTLRHAMRDLGVDPAFAMVVEATDAPAD